MYSSRPTDSTRQFSDRLPTPAGRLERMLKEQSFLRSATIRKTSATKGR